VKSRGHHASEDDGIVSPNQNSPPRSQYSGVSAVVQKAGPHSLASVADAMTSLDRLDAEVKNPSTFEQIIAAKNSAAVIQGVFKDVKAVADRAGEVIVDAEAVIGAEWAKRVTA
jgi:L-fucose mutarotase/ribose pyranase (RbsD/FucU family)